jgi:putative tricarboxylic transport membrane protein
MKKVLASLLLFSTAINVQAADIHFMIPGGAGSGWDRTARGVGMVLRDAALIDNASFENISGAGGGVAIGTLIETADRRSTTLMVNSTPIVVRSLTKLFPYSFRDLTPIARVIGDYQALIVRADSDIRDFNDVLTRFRENPRSVKFAGGSVRGDLDHLVPALAIRAAGEDPRAVAYVPYDGGGKALAGFLTGEADVLSTGFSEVLEYHRAGRLRIIAVSAPQRVAGLPGIATFIEQGVDFEFVNWRGFFAAPGISSQAANEYSALLRKMQTTAGWEELRSRNGWQNLFLPREEFVAFLGKQERDIGDLMSELGFLRTITQ